MNARCLSLSTLVCCCCLLAPSALAGEGFKFPSLNPFAGKKKSAEASLSDGPGSTTIPSADGSVEPEKPKTAKASTANRSVPAKPTTFQKVNAGTQNFLGKTKDVLMPWGKSKPQPAPKQATGTVRVYNGSALTPKPAEKKSFFGSMFSSEKPPKEPATVNDFIGQPRVPF